MEAASKSFSVQDGSNVLLVGDDWTLNVFADSFSKKGVSPKVLQLKTPLTVYSGLQSVFVGNGDPKDRVTKTMGPELANSLWRISEANYEMGKEFFSKQNIEIYEKGLLRWEGSTSLGEAKGFSFDTEKIKTLRKADHFGEVERIERLSSLQMGVRLKGQAEPLVAPIIVFLSDFAAHEKFNFLWDKLIPVTLSTFGYPIQQCPEFSMSIHNQGADFAIRFNKQIHLGSYRNLYEDKGVGLKETADPVTLKNCAKYFGDMKWVDPGKKPETTLAIEGLSCDGLPLVGTLPEAPGVYIVGGFSARTSNFIFEIAHILSSSILSDGKTPSLDPFSLKRLH